MFRHFLNWIIPVFLLSNYKDAALETVDTESFISLYAR